MRTLQGDSVSLRALEPDDLEFVLDIENDENLWELSNTQAPYSRYLIKQYLENSHRDIYEVKQLRLVIVNQSYTTIGLIDLFDFDFKNKRAGVGVLIKDAKNRRKGYASEALELLINYSFIHLDLHQLYCNIFEDNKESLQLFINQGFEKIGLKKDWNYNNGVFKSEYSLQLIRK